MKYKYHLRNLDCAACANKLEAHLKESEHLKNVSVNFSKLTLSFETDLDKNILEYVTKLSHEVEDEVEILAEEKEHDLKEELTFDIIKLSIGIILTLVGLLTDIPYLSKTLVILAYVVLLYEISLKAIKMLFKSFSIDEHLLITISCIGAYFIGSVGEGLMVVILYEIGEILEHIAVHNSRKSISDLMNIKPEYANLKKDNEIIKTNPEDINIDDIIVIKKGEKIPLDGIIIKGESSLNTSALTGESKLREVRPKDEILSGCINTGDVLELKVTSTYENSTVARILNLVENATDNKAKTENFVSRAAKIYTPIVILLAIVVAFLFPAIFDMSYKEAIYRSLSFLVISCPCAIAISVPLSYFTGIGRASKEGILIKGSDYLDNLRNINNIIFDKTGTITKGEFTDFNLVILNDSYKKEEIIEYYLKGELLSTHPLSTAITNYFNKKVSKEGIENYQDITGKGLSYELNGKKIFVGSSNLVKSETKDNSIYLKVDKDIIAKLELTDALKEDSQKTIKELNDMNINTMMFTGDSSSIALEIGRKVGIKEVSSELLPEDKYKKLESVIKNNQKGFTAFVGDGINDAPSLARADIGIGMGNVGSASAIEASDIIISNDNIHKIIDAIKISKKTNNIIKQNLIFAIGVKILVLTLSALGISSMWQAVFADTGVTLLTIINTTRILKK